MHEFPLLASSAGVHDADDRLDRVAAATQLHQLEHWPAIAAELAALRPDQMSAADRVTAAVLAEELRARIAAIEHRAYLLPIRLVAGPGGRDGSGRTGCRSRCTGSRPGQPG